MTFDEKIDSCDVKPDDVPKLISDKLPECCNLGTNLDNFSKSLQKQGDFKPFGELKHAYSVDKDGQDRKFEVYKVDHPSAEFLQFYERMESFAMWFIDAATYTNTEDDRFVYYVVHEKCHHGSETWYEFVGYATVYNYYAYPEHIRPRIAHILVLPPHRQCGHGVHMLQTIYKEAIANRLAIDITAEDPSDYFIRLRDFVDCVNCSQLVSFQPDLLKQGFSPKMYEEAKEKLKLGKKQVRRVYEILRLKSTDCADKEEFKKYRLDIKRRLNVPFQKSKQDLAKMSKVLEGPELTSMMTLTNPELRLPELQKMFEQTVEEYRQTLNRLATYGNTVPAIHMQQNGHA